MTNEELIHQFEADAEPERPFHHADHVRLAFAYLSKYGVLQALEKFASALKRYAAVRGKSQLYNDPSTARTLTSVIHRNDEPKLVDFYPPDYAVACCR